MASSSSNSKWHQPAALGDLSAANLHRRRGCGGRLHGRPRRPRRWRRRAAVGEAEDVADVQKESVSPGKTMGNSGKTPIEHGDFPQ